MFDFSLPVVLWLSLIPSFYSLAGLGLCQDPAGPSLSAVSSNSSIVSATSNEMQKVVVIPKTQNNIQQIQQSIDTTIKTGHAKIVESKHMSGYNGVLLWSVNAEKMEIDVLRQKLGNLVDIEFNLEVAGPCGLDLPQTNHLVEDTIRQSHASQDLRVVSWPPNPEGVQLADLQFYAFEEEGGENTFIYVIENGIEPELSDFANMRHPPTDWFYAPEARETRSDDSTDSKGNPSGHGSCVASKAAGAIYGVSKNSKLVIVKSSLLQGDIVYSFSKVLDDIIDRNRQRKTVVVFAATSNGNSEDWSWRRVKSSIEDLIAADAVIIVPSGNRAAFHRRAKDVFTFPAVWEAPDFPLIVAGAVENDGTESVYSQGPRHVTTWAPGKVTCAKPSSGTASDIGTSFSTGMVAGLVAYFLGIPGAIATGNGQTARNTRNLLQGKAGWPRKPGGRPVIYNGEDGRALGLNNSVAVS